MVASNSLEEVRRWLGIVCAKEITFRVAASRIRIRVWDTVIGLGLGLELAIA